SGLELPPSRSRQRDPASSPRSAAKGGPRYRLEGASPVVWSVSPAQRSRQEAARHHCGDCPRDGRVPLGDRPPGQPGCGPLTSQPIDCPAAQRWGWSNGGELPSLVMWPAPPDARPLDRGKPRDESTEGGSQPADKSLIDRRLNAPSPTLRSSTSSHRRPSDADRPHLASTLDRGHKRLVAVFEARDGVAAAVALDLRAPLVARAQALEPLCIRNRE